MIATPAPSLAVSAYLVLAALTNSGLPAILVASKCEHPQDQWEVDAENIANHRFFKACVTSFQVSNDTPEIARTCLQTMLKVAVQHRKGEQNLEMRWVVHLLADCLQKKRTVRWFQEEGRSLLLL